MTDCTYLLQQRINMLEQNAFFAKKWHLVSGYDDVYKLWYADLIFVDPGVEDDGTCYCDLLLSYQLLSAIHQVFREFIFQQDSFLSVQGMLVFRDSVQFSNNICFMQSNNRTIMMVCWCIITA